MIRNAFVSLLSFIAIDSLWLGVISPGFYRAHIGHLMRDSPDLIAALAFYLLFLVGLNLFVIIPQREAPLKRVAAYGAAFGCVTYATFDLTSVAVFKDFPYLVAGVDLLWGSFLCLSISVITLKLDRIFDRSSS
jgi:uncharacterized membrane protein